MLHIHKESSCFIYFCRVYKESHEEQLTLPFLLHGHLYILFSCYLQHDDPLHADHKNLSTSLTDVSSNSATLKDTVWSLPVNYM